METRWYPKGKYLAWREGSTVNLFVWRSGERWRWVVEIVNDGPMLGQGICGSSETAQRAAVEDARAALREELRKLEELT